MKQRITENVRFNFNAWTFFTILWWLVVVVTTYNGLVNKLDTAIIAINDIKNSNNKVTTTLLDHEKRITILETKMWE